MKYDRVSVRDQAYADVRHSSSIVVKAWNQCCPHGNDARTIREDFLKYTDSEYSAHLTAQERQRLTNICRCCLRLVPDWGRLVAHSFDAGFQHPDSAVRGLLLRCAIFLIRMESYLDYEVTSILKNKIAQRLEAEGEFREIVVEGFLDTLESECIAADTCSNPPPSKIE
jgi:hypothetical protein